MDFLGCVEIPLLYIPPPELSHPEWYRLKDERGMKPVKGDINIHAAFKFKPYHVSTRRAAQRD